MVFMVTSDVLKSIPIVLVSVFCLVNKLYWGDRSHSICVGVCRKGPAKNKLASKIVGYCPFMVNT